VKDILSDVEPGEEAPNGFALGQNYPNPFNPSTTIRYELPVRSAVELTAHNALGQQVREIVSSEVVAGYHEATFDASGLSSGVYFYGLRAGNTVLTRKMLLVR
jgi:glucuronoarabinoxylan endo-1,4-beta-xylanase